MNEQIGTGRQGLIDKSYADQQTGQLTMNQYTKYFCDDINLQGRGQGRVYNAGTQAVRWGEGSLPKKLVRFLNCFFELLRLRGKVEREGGRKRKARRVVFLVAGRSCE